MMRNANCMVVDGKRFLAFQLGTYKVMRWGALKRGLGIRIPHNRAIAVPVMEVSVVVHHAHVLWCCYTADW